MGEKEGGVWVYCIRPRKANIYVREGAIYMRGVQASQGATVGMKDGTGRG